MTKNFQQFNKENKTASFAESFGRGKRKGGPACRNIIICNSEDPDQTLHYAASNLGHHCSPISQKQRENLQFS